MKGTVDEVWSKSYAKELFEEAKLHPDVAELVGNIKTKIRQRVDIEQIMDLYHDIKYVADVRCLRLKRRKSLNPPMQAVEYVTSALPDGHIVVPAEVVTRFKLTTVTKMRIVVIREED